MCIRDRNYRGITLLSVVGKVLEWIMNKRMYKLGEKLKLICDEQGGFREDRGCVDLIFMLSEVVQARNEQNKPTYLRIIDVKKAYDTVWQAGLWSKLWQLGIRGKMWRILKEWYEGMESVVLLDGESSRAFPIEQGVKQGAITSPLLYSIFLSDAAIELESASMGVSFEGRWAGMMVCADDRRFSQRTAEYDRYGGRVQPQTPIRDACG